MKKRILSFLCAAVLLVTLLPVPALAANNAAGFTDTDGHWAKAYIQEAVQAQILRGVSETSFAPDTGMTRAMFVTAISRLAQQNGAKTAARSKTGFTDVPQDAWYASHLCWAVENGIITGISKTRFAPDGLVTREQMCAIIERLLALLGKTPKESTRSARTFTDGAAISDFAEDAVSLMTRLDIIAGYPDGSFAPKSPVTRAEAAKVLCALDAYLEQTEKNVQSGLISGSGSHHSGSSGDSGNSGSGGSGETKDTYTVTFLTNAGDDTVSNMPSAQRVTSGGHVSPPSLTPAREGYLFIAWLDAEEQLFDFTSAITANTELHAAWKKDMSDPNGSEGPAGDTPISYLYDQDPEAYRLDDGSYTIYYPNLLDVFMLGEFTSEKAQAIADAAGGTIAGQLTGAVPFLQLLVPAKNAAEIEALAEKLMERSDVAYASCDIPMIMDTNAADNNPWPDNALNPETDRGNEENPAGRDWWAEAIHAYTAWENYTQYASPVKVGVIDDGFDTEHKDIKDAYSFLPQYPNQDQTLHGTHVSGIIAARNNDICIRGVADFIQDGDLICVDWGVTNKEGKKVELLSTGDYLNIIKTMLAAGVKVINCSFGIFTDSELKFMKDNGKNNPLAHLFLKFKGSYESYLEVLNNQIQLSGQIALNAISQLLERGVTDFLIVQSAGNGYDGAYKDGIEAVRNGYFASITTDSIRSVIKKRQNGLTVKDYLDHIIIVAGADNGTVDDYYSISRGSNYGTYVTICAPGSNILSLNRDGAFSRCNTLSGTSMSAPMVTGAAALVWGIDPTLTAGEVRYILTHETNTKAVGSKSNGDSLIYPMLDVGMAAKAAYEGRPAHPSPAPDPEPVEELGSGSVKLTFYDKTTNNPIPVTDVFSEYTQIGIGTSVGDEYYQIYGSLYGAANNLDSNLQIGDEGYSLIFTGVHAGHGEFWYEGSSPLYLLVDSNYDLVIPDVEVPEENGVTVKVYLEPKVIIVGDTRVTSANAADILGNGTARYDLDFETLTLTNANITAKVPVSSNGRLDIVLPENTASTLTVTKAGTDVISAFSCTITGNVSEGADSSANPQLTLKGNGLDSLNSYGIHSKWDLDTSKITLEISGTTRAILAEHNMTVFSGSHITCHSGSAAKTVSTGHLHFQDDLEFIITSTIVSPETDPVLLDVDFLSGGWESYYPHYVETQQHEENMKMMDSYVEIDGKPYLRCGDGTTYPTYIRIYRNSSST